MADNVIPDTSRTLGREAQKANIMAARVVADIVKTTLGPKGMDKMLVDSTGNVTVTNDGVTILEELEMDHPVAKLIVESAKTQENEVGDGTTSVALLAGSLLERGEKLIDRKMHPTAIVRGYQTAAIKAKEIILSLCSKVDSRETLKKIAMTSMTGKGAESVKEKLAETIVDAIDRVSDSQIDLNSIKVAKIKSENFGAELVDGIVLDKEIAHADMPRSISDARIALIDFPLEIKSPETETKLEISTHEQLRRFLESEENALHELTSKIISSGANVIFCQKGIDDVAQYYLANAGIIGVRRVPKSDMEKLAKATSARIVSNISDMNAERLGYSKSVEETRGKDKLIYVRGCKNPKSVTIVVSGSVENVVDEIERAVQDGLGVVASAARDKLVVAGGGAVEIALAQKIREFARTLGGREQLAVEEFANALEIIPETLAENAGLDAIEVIAEMKKRHALGKSREGINLLTDKIEDCLEAGIIEPVKIKTQAISAATEVACTILRIDDVLVTKKSQEAKKSGYEGMD